MKKHCTTPGLYLPVILICLFFAVIGCKKKDNETPTTSLGFQDAAKAWFMANHGTTDLSGRLDWNKATAFTRKDGVAYLQVPISTAGTVNAKLVKTSSTQFNPDPESMRTYTKLLLYKDQGYFKAFIMQVLQETTKPEDVSYDKLPDGWAGYIYYTNLKGSLYSGYEYNAGKVVKRMRSADLSGSISARTDCYQTRADYYQQVTTGIYTSDWTYLYSIVTTTCIYTPDAQGEPIDYRQDPGGGGGYVVSENTETTPYIVQDIFTNNLTTPCFINAVNAVNQGSLQNTITKILRNVFNHPGKLHVRFWEDILADTVDGNTQALRNGSDPATADWYMDITLNKKLTTLFGASKEYVVATVLHETLHAYFMATAANRQKYIDIDHNDMGLFYISDMANALKEIFPGLSDSVATALSWGGVQKSYSWSELKRKDSGTANRFAQINQDHKNGRKGAICN